MMVKNNKVLLLLMIGVLFFSCTPRTKYERRLKSELASGIRQDSLFLGIRLGMSDFDFYTRCWELNRQGLIKQGSGNMSVEYKLENELKHPVTLNFYPNFQQGKIYEMPVRFMYNGWTPWDKEYSAESLEADVLNWYKKIYGKPFIEVKHPKWGTAYVKIDGNRRITIFKEDESHVWAVFTDMTVTKEQINSGTGAGQIQEDITKKLEGNKDADQ